MQSFFDYYLPHLAGRPILLLAPMEGITSPGIRKLYCRFSIMDIIATEFIRITGERQTIPPIARPEIPLQIQVMGNCPKTISGWIEFSKNNEILNDHDWLELNAGCPSKRVNSGSAGVALLRTPKLLSEIINAMRTVHSGPLSLKTRLAFRDKDEFPHLLSCFKELPIDFITINARRGSDDPDQSSDLDCLKEAVEDLPFPVIGNGGIWNANDAIEMLKHTGAAGLMCGRGAIANPFLFEEIIDVLQGEGDSPSSPDRPDEKTKRLYEFISELLKEFKRQEENSKSKSRSGAYKEFAFWLSRNPLIGEAYFSGIKRMKSLDDISALTNQYFNNSGHPYY